MCSRADLDIILTTFSQDTKQLFGDRLKSIILYGSYARGDYDEGSDIDVMVLVDIPKDELHRYNRPLNRLADRADWDFSTILSPTIVSAAEFAAYKRAMPFYRNVDSEGVRLV